MGCDTAAIVRFEADGMGDGAWAAHQGPRRVPGATGSSPIPGTSSARCGRTGRAARFDTDDPAAPGHARCRAGAQGHPLRIAAPIVVDGDLWGTITVASLERSLPVSTEQRLAVFTELVATAIANTRGARGAAPRSPTSRRRCGGWRRWSRARRRRRGLHGDRRRVQARCSASGRVVMVRYEAGPSHRRGGEHRRRLPDVYPVGSRHPLRRGPTTRACRTGRRGAT